MKVLVCLVGLVGCFLLVSFVKFRGETLATPNAFRDKEWKLVNGEMQRVDLLRTVSSFSPEVDREWISILKSGQITLCAPFDTFDAYADKWLVLIEGKYKGMIKLMEKHSILDRGLRMVSWNENTHHGTKRAESGGYQAMPELVSWHVDRILDFYRKPPITSRYVSSYLLYPSFLTSLLPSYQIPVTVHAWIDELQKDDPDTSYMNYMVTDKLLPLTNSYAKNQVLQISDVLVFDFLVDDHDRQAEKNWVYRESLLLLWDNGLAFNHGPVGDSDCLDILCGSNTWRKQTGRGYPCKRTCVFRKSTIDKIRAVGPDANETNRLGYLLRQALLANEPEFFPLFHYGVYFSDISASEIIRFHPEQFFGGIDRRVALLLNHVNSCIVKHGESKVLLVD